MRRVLRSLQRWAYIVPLRLRSLFRRGDVEQDLDEEIRFHLEQQVDDLVATGVDAFEAPPDRRPPLWRGGSGEGRVPGREACGHDRDGAAGHPLCGAGLSPQSRVHGGRRAHARSREWRQHRGLQSRGWRAVVAAPVSRSRPPGQRHRHVSERRVCRDARAGPDDRRGSVCRRTRVHAHRRRRAGPLVWNACLGRADGNPWRQAGARSMASAGRRRRRTGSLPDHQSCAVAIPVRQATVSSSDAFSPSTACRVRSLP